MSVIRKGYIRPERRFRLTRLRTRSNVVHGKHMPTKRKQITTADDTVIVSFRVPRDVLKRIEDRADEQRRTVSNLVRVIVEDAVNGGK
jgi:hypothetical protein